MNEVKNDVVEINQSDLEIKTVRGSGPGGQARNKLETCVVITHIPTGIVVRCDSERSQFQNKRIAMDMINSKLATAKQEALKSSVDQTRKSMVGSGQRGDKVSTARFQDDQITYHNIGKKLRLTEWNEGKWDKLFEE